MKKNRVYAICMLITLSILLIDSCKKEDENIIITDLDGNIYNTVTIGTQVWMKENLKATTFNDGTPIPQVTDVTDWFNLITPGYCWYDNDEATYKETYGALYNWYAVETGKLCPTGWHVPSDDDWQILVLLIDPDAEIGFSESINGGSMLKESGTAHWSNPNDDATNEYGFSALPGGCRLNYNDINYYGIYEFGFWWSSTEYDETRAWIIDMGYNYTNVARYRSAKINGESVRCVKD
jgi:uncharacterized protein (TIGR02145 family)